MKKIIIITTILVIAFIVYTEGYNHILINEIDYSSTEGEPVISSRVDLINNLMTYNDKYQYTHGDINEFKTGSEIIVSIGVKLQNISMFKASNIASMVIEVQEDIPTFFKMEPPVNVAIAPFEKGYNTIFYAYVSSGDMTSDEIYETLKSIKLKLKYTNIFGEHTKNVKMNEMIKIR